MSHPPQVEILYSIKLLMTRRWQLQDKILLSFSLWGKQHTKAAYSWYIEDSLLVWLTYHVINMNKVISLVYKGKWKKYKQTSRCIETKPGHAREIICWESAIEKIHCQTVNFQHLIRWSAIDHCKVILHKKIDHIATPPPVTFSLCC